MTPMLSRGEPSSPVSMGMPRPFQARNAWLQAPKAEAAIPRFQRMEASFEESWSAARIEQASAEAHSCRHL